MPRTLTVDQVREGLPVLCREDTVEPVLYGLVRILYGHPGRVLLGAGPDHVMVEWLGADQEWGLDCVGYGRIGPRLDTYGLNVPESDKEWQEAVARSRSTLIYTSCAA